MDTDSTIRANARLSLSSMYQKSSEVSLHKARQSFLLGLWWRLDSYLDSRKALRLSNMVLKDKDLEDLTVEQLLVRAQILQRRRRHLDALVCIEEGLSRWQLQPTPDEKLALFIEKGEIFLKLNRDVLAEVTYDQAWGYRLTHGISIPTLVRLMNSFGKFKQSQGDMLGANGMFQLARNLVAAQNPLGAKK